MGGGSNVKVVTAKEMRLIDTKAIEEYGIPAVVLMENAGLEVTRKIVDLLGDVQGRKICIFAGKGNNGGDGFVVARHLSNRGAKVKVFLVVPRAEVRGDALIQLHILERMKIDVMEVVTERDWDKVKLAITFADCLVDALVGVGFQGVLEGALAILVELMNQSQKLIVSIDIASGIDADNGQVRGAAVQATHTVTCGLPKVGSMLYPGAAYSGAVHIADIGLPLGLLTEVPVRQQLIIPPLVRQLLVKRAADVHKGQCGRVSVVAGSPGMTGAAALTSLAALKTGAGLVTLAAGCSLQPVLATKLTEVMTQALPEVETGIIGPAALPELLAASEAAAVLAVGPGLGRHEATAALVKELVRQSTRPLVLDADALYALNGHTALLATHQAPLVVTPHVGEMARLVGMSAEEVNEDRLYIARQAAAEWQCVVVLKGARTIVAFPDGEAYVNTSGNAGMATAGSGDVLTGAIAGLMAQGMSAPAAAVVGVYLHGLAGDITAKAGMIGMTAGDILNALPAAIQGISETR